MPTIKLPGLIDIHVHLRDPGQTHKEDFYTGTSAALAGGFTTVIDMPNNTVPITTEASLRSKMKIASAKTVCDIGFYFGSLGDNYAEFAKVKDKVFGLKLYLNLTTGGFIITPESMRQIYQAWPSQQPVLLHSEEDMIAMVIAAVRKSRKSSHFCHVSSRNELSQIIKAKTEGLPVTCGVCPHHLFLTENDVKQLGAYGKMKPPLHTQRDVEFIWKNLQYVDVIESDHAPHTKAEKEADTTPFGVPGLETTLPLLLMAEKQGRLTRAKLISLCFARPAEILRLRTDPKTQIQVEDSEYTLENKNLYTKCGWTPFAGMKVRGKVQQVKIRGKVVVKDGEVIAKPGSGKVIQP